MKHRARGDLLTRPALVVLCFVLFRANAFASWSVIAVDKSTGTIVIASAACVPQARFANFPARDLMDIQAIVAPGKGAAVAQASADNTRANQRLLFAELQKGTAPADMLKMLGADPKIQSRQFAIVDLQGRAAGFTGASNPPVAVDQHGSSGTDIFVSIAGNNMPSVDAVTLAMQAFKDANGSLSDRVMAAMEAADSKGGDRRCSCAAQVPFVDGRNPLQGIPCDAKTAHVAYLLRAEATDSSGSSFNDGAYAMYISVTDRNITKNETANPVRTLRRRYEAVKENK